MAGKVKPGHGSYAVTRIDLLRPIKMTLTDLPHPPPCGPFMKEL